MASCSARVSAPCASRGHVRGRASRLGRPHRVETAARGSRRGGLAATASGPDAAADVDEAAAALVAWATADGLRLSPKVAVGAPFPGAPRGLVATQDIESGETVLTLPASCTAFDAKAARADKTLGLGAGIAAYESAPRATRGADVSEETALALFVALARRHPSRTNFGAYVEALPASLPESPLFMDEATFRSAAPAMPLSLVEAADDARADLFLAWDVAAAVFDFVPGEPELGLEEFQWAWASVRSRAITFRVARGGANERRGDVGELHGGFEEDSFTKSVASATQTARELKKKRNAETSASASRHAEARRCLVPVVDMMNHACAAFAGSDASNAAFPGPAVTAAPTPAEDGVDWRAARFLKKGEEVTWTYGAELSNEHLWLHYGFVPDPPVHLGCAVTFSFPANALIDGIRAVAAEDDEATSLKRFALLERCGLVDVDGDSRADFATSTADASFRRESEKEGKKHEDVGEREGDVALQFTVTLGELPNALAGIAGVACCAPEEVRVMHEGVFSRPPTPPARGVGKTELEISRDCVSLCPESRRRAGRYVAFLLARVAPTATGGDVAAYDNGGTDDTESSPAKAAALAAATRAREGARAAFAWLEPVLENEALLEDGAWIEDAVAAAVLE